MTEYFTRILTKERLDKAIGLLDEFNPKVERTETAVRVSAPDGDRVLIAMQDLNGLWITRFHKEVFDESV